MPRIHQHAKCRPFFPCVLRVIPETPIWPVSLNQTCDKIRQINRPWAWFNHIWMRSEHTSIHNVGPFHPCFPREKPCNRSGRTDEQAEKRSRLVGWTNAPMNRWKHGISGFRRTDGGMDRRTNIKHNAVYKGTLVHNKMTNNIGGCNLSQRCWMYCIFP